MKFCSNCANTLVLEVPDGDSMMRYICKNCNSVYYQNPKMVVGCVVNWGSKVLLAKRSIEPCIGKWNLPAGYLENGESVEEGALREVLEETGAKVSISNLHCIYDLVRVQQVYLLFLASSEDGQCSVGEETLEVAWFEEEKIPWKDMAFSSSTFALKRFFADRNSGVIKLHRGKYPEED